MNRSDLGDISRRPVAYWHVDGVPELTTGLLWILWGAALLVGPRLPARWANVYWAVTPVLIASSGFGAIWAIKRVKAHVTFPRTGYVEWKEPGAATRLTAALIGVIAAMVMVIAVNDHRSDASLAAPIVAVVLSLAFAAAAIRWRLAHYLFLAAVAMALGLALRRVDRGWAAVNWLLLALGAATALVGAFRLLIFMRKHPRASMENA